MNKSIQVCFVFILSFIIQHTYAQNRDDIALDITSGTVTVTSSGFGGEQTATRATLSGSLIAFLPGGATQLFFTSSDISTSPNVDFSLPSDPNQDSNGTTRDAMFTFDQSVLSVDGTIDQRAFDGPLIEYSFTAVIGEGEIDESFDASGLYSARPDFRECLSPVCGGWFVKKLNRVRTRCADGTRQRECYVASANTEDFDFSNARIPSFDNQKPYIFRGELSEEEFDGVGSFGVFTATEIYQSVSNDSATGRFYGLENLGISCITSPCFSYDAHVLNRTRVANISSLDFSGVNADTDLIDTVEQHLSDGEVVLVSGRTRGVQGFSGRGRELVANQLYIPLRPEVTTIPCFEGYSLFSDNVCRTPSGCEYPLIELTSIGGAPIIDPVTGEITSSRTTSCVESCDFPREIVSPAQCLVLLP